MQLIAHVLSHLLNPSAVSCFLWSWWLWENPADLVDFIAGIVFWVFAPTAFIFFILRIGRINSLYPGNRRQRNIPLLFGFCCYSIGCVVLYVLSADPFLQSVGIYTVLVTGIVGLINYAWKISIHCVGVSGAATLFVCYTGNGLFWGLVAILLISWARIYIKAHTPLQSITGLALGIITAFVTYTVMIGSVTVAFI